jgi:hypothetical protein
VAEQRRSTSDFERLFKIKHVEAQLEELVELGWVDNIIDGRHVELRLVRCGCGVGPSGQQLYKVELVP